MGSWYPRVRRKIEKGTAVEIAKHVGKSHVGAKHRPVIATAVLIADVCSDRDAARSRIQPCVGVATISALDPSAEKPNAVTNQEEKLIAETVKAGAVETGIADADPVAHPRCDVAVAGRQLREVPDVDPVARPHGAVVADTVHPGRAG